MTIGIVLVPCLAARTTIACVEKRTSTLRCHEFGDNSWDAVPISLGVAILKQDIFPFNVTEILQSLPKYLDTRTRLVAIAGYNSYPGNFRRLLRLGERAKRKEHGEKSKDRDFFLHAFFFLSIHLSLDTRLDPFSLDHLLRAHHHHWWNRQAKRFGGFEIDHEFELGWLLDRQIGRLGAF